MKATFRGVPFFVETSERSGGRRGPIHEYPLRSEPFFDDLGRKARGFPVEGYVLGDDYLSARDALLEALETAGPGELVHPTHGTRRVVAVSYRVRESVDRKRIATFSIEFVETPAKPAEPSTVPDAAGAVRTSAAAAKDSVNAEFLATYRPGPLLASVADSLRSATLAVDNVVSRARSDAQELAAIKKKVQEFQASISELVELPADLAVGLLELVEFGGSMLEVYDYSPGVRPPGTTANRLQERTNFDATQRLIQRLVVIQAAIAATEETFTSYEEAVAARDRIADLLDEQIDVATDDTYPALIQLRADLVKAIPGEDGDLPRLVRYTPPAAVPSLVLAHRLYGDLSLEADLINRNNVRNPCFVRGQLEVLSRD